MDKLEVLGEEGNYESEEEIQTTSEALLEALCDTGVEYIFANLGSDHPAVIEAFSKLSSQKKDFPKVIICPHEYVALSAAQGYTQATGRAQAVFIHLDVGTQNLGGAVHNVFRSKIPVLIFAGDTPYTVEGELFGTRNTPINFLQDIDDQRSIVRPYVKWEYEIRTGKNIKQLIYRSLQISNSSPQGPVYLMGAREVLEEEVPTSSVTYKGWQPPEPQTVSYEVTEQIVDELLNAESPLVITSYLGRKQDAVDELVKLCEKLAIPVIETKASYMNFPADSLFHYGYEVDENIYNADLIFVIDCDVPWVPSKTKLNPGSKVYYLDEDPLKERIPLWYFQSERFIKGDSLTVLKQINMHLDEAEVNQEKIKNRKSILIERKNNQKFNKMVDSPSDLITTEFLTKTINEVINEDTIVLNETITNEQKVFENIPRSKKGSFYGNGGSSLGWNGGAAIGVKLANPDKTVLNLTGDGCYFFSIPSSVYWMARRYNTPFLTVIFNNKGWNATKQNVLRLHPDGVSKQNDSFWVNFHEPAELEKIAEAAGGAYAQSVDRKDELKAALIKGLEEVEKGRCAVINVNLKPISTHQYEV